ncbi:endothelin-converting enzyme homolog [Nephila pilipes]|uniref:Endothelin-converting enzyme homolog n=1 Tax=Nephila pilipes TaxID=299642 RepID=A0A8X6UE05_NEPPI|nr:endothelin-converting enzyme homolog [Nephila pilipes]
MIPLRLCITVRRTRMFWDSKHPTPKYVKYCISRACVKTAANILNFMDQSVNPCEDFYQYACGDWIKSNPLRENKTSLSRFEKLSENNDRVLKYVLADRNFTLKSKAEKKARIFFHSCLNDTRIEELGAQPMLDLLKKVGGWAISGQFNITDWNFQEMFELLHNQYGAPSFYQWLITEDLKNSSQNSLTIDQAGLILSSRNYYLNKTMNGKILRAYLSYMTKIGVLLGGKENTTRLLMQDVIEFEIKLAEITTPEEEKRDYNAIYKKITINQLQKLAPFIKWKQFFNSAFKMVGREIYSPQAVVLLDLPYIQKLSNLVTQYLSQSLGRVTLVNYLAWRLVHSKVPLLSIPFREAGADLSLALLGSVEKKTRWKTCIAAVDNSIGFALSSMYIRKSFLHDSKTLVNNMIDEIKTAFKENFPLIDWMDSETRNLSVDKVDSVTDMVGYPEYITHPNKLDEIYDGLEFNETEYFKNHLNQLHFEIVRNMKKLDLLANRNEWSMTPSTVNAYYSPPLNHIVIPAGILQPPFYDLTFPKSVNFGSIGVVMGHELTHAFDDQGRLYDKHGNLHQWWKNSTIQNFQQRSKCFIDQYSNYEVQGMKLNGLLTLGENIADNGGLKASFHAYQNWIAKNHAELPLPGLNLSTNQLFFVAFAQTWCSVSTPENQRHDVLTNVHSPAKYRVIGTISNSVDFAREFKCPSKSTMNPEKKCEVW